MMLGTGNVAGNRNGFSLIELLVVVAIIAILAAVLFPVFTQARLRGRVAQVHSDLRQIGTAIEMYKEDFRGLPPVRSSCMGNAQVDYHELPRELFSMRYLAAHRMYDPFNRTRAADDTLGRTYKYVAINWGYSNGTKTDFTMWIPRDYPANREDCLLYYRDGSRIFVFDGGKMRPRQPPVMWAVWSVGPGGDPGWVAAGERMLPAPRSQWYPNRHNGVIVRFSDGRSSP